MWKSGLLTNKDQFREHYDATVIGTGLGGATTALRLAVKGLKVLLVEQGDFIDPTSADQPEPKSRYILDFVKHRSAPLHFVGGATKFYAAALYRFHESDFQEVQLEAGKSPAWPVQYAELEPYYQEAERIYKVHGSAEDDPGAAPRSHPLPFAPLPHAPLVETMVTRLRANGVVISSIPKSVDYGPGGKCVNCADCDAFFCARDAKMDAEIACVRPALLTGNVTLATQTACGRVVLEGGSGGVSGVILHRDGEVFEVPSRVVVVSAGLKGAVELLLRSRTSEHPAGLGNNEGMLGRNLAGHAGGWVFPFVSLKKLPPLQSKTFAINTFYERAPDWPYPLGVIQMAGQMPFWRGRGPLKRFVTKQIAEHCLTMFYMTESPPTREAGFLIEGHEVVGQIDPPHSFDSLRRLRKLTVKYLNDAGYPALAPITPPSLGHPVGVARMGKDPSDSVVDSIGQVHGVGRLFIADASTLPSAGAVNTGLTIAALALRTADHIARTVV